MISCNAKIVKVGEAKTTQYGVRIDLDVVRLDTGAKMRVACFAKEAGAFKNQIGDEVSMSLKEVSKDDKTYYNVSPKDIALLIPAAKSDVIIPQEVKPDWDAKELRTHRRACLAISSGLIRQEELLGEPDGDARLGMLQLMAEKLVEYVYHGCPKLTIAQADPKCQEEVKKVMADWDKTLGMVRKSVEPYKEEPDATEEALFD